MLARLQFKTLERTGRTPARRSRRLKRWTWSSGKLVDLSAGDCEFGYRTSRFKTRDRDRFVITRVTYRLAANGKPAVRYAELRRYLADRSLEAPTLADVRDAVLTIRRRKAMVIDPIDTDSRSIGSFFVNPTISDRRVRAAQTTNPRAN